MLHAKGGKSIIIEILILFSISCIHNEEKVEKFQCKLTPLWDVRGCRENKSSLFCKKGQYGVLKKKAEIFLGGLKSKNSKKRSVAISKLNAIIPFIYRYIKKNYKESLLLSLPPFTTIPLNIVSIYKYINFTRISELQVICHTRNDYIWYAVVDNREIITSKISLLIVGNKNGPFSSVPILLGNDVRWNIEDYSCNFINGIFRNYAILINAEVDKKKYYSIVISNGKVLKDHNFYRNDTRTNYVITKVLSMGKYGISREVITIGQEQYEIKKVLFSPDNKTTVFVVRNNNNKYTALINGKKSEEYSEINTSTIRFSPDNKRIAFKAIKSTEKEVMVVDMKESREYKHIFTPVFSPDNKVGFIAITPNNKTVVVVDGKESKEYDYVNSLTFSKDGKRYGFIAKKGDKWVAVIDGQEKIQYEEIESLSFSENGNVKINAKDGDKKVQVIFAKNKRIKKIHPYPVTQCISQGQKKVAYVVRKDDKDIVIVDKKAASKKYPRITYLKFSPNCNRIAFIVKKWLGNQEKVIAVVDNKEGKEYDKIRGLIFSPDSRNVVYWGLVEKKWKLVINGKESEEYKQVSHITFTPDGKIGYAASEDSKIIAVINNKKTKKYDEIIIPGPTPIILSTRMFYHYSDPPYLPYIGNGRYVLIGKEIGATTQYNLVVDGEEFMSLKNISTVFTDNKSIEFAGYIGNKIYWIKCK